MFIAKGHSPIPRFKGTVLFTESITVAGRADAAKEGELESWVQLVENLGESSTKQEKKKKRKKIKASFKALTFLN